MLMVRGGGKALGKGILGLFACELRLWLLRMQRMMPESRSGVTSGKMVQLKTREGRETGDDDDHCEQ